MYHFFIRNFVTPIATDCVTQQLAKRNNPPPLRDHAQFGLFKAVREQGGGGLIHPVRLLAARLGVDRLEIDKPGFKQRLRNRLQRGIGFAEQSNAVVEGAKKCSNFLV